LAAQGNSLSTPTEARNFSPPAKSRLANSVEQLEDALHDMRRAIDPNNVLSLVPLTVADAEARFADPIVFSPHS
jgi:hypothetical protein